MGSGRQGKIEFHLEFIFKNVLVGKEGWITSNPFAFLSAAWRVSRSEVDVVIVSLWRGSIVGLLAKFLRPRIKLVVFLHLPSDVHFVDFVFTRLSVLLAMEVWGDSKATLAGRVPDTRPEKCRVISFVAQQFEPLPARPVSPSFIFWGRINQQKGLDRAIRIFARVHEWYPKALLKVVGPDCGALSDLQQLCKSLGLKDQITFLGAATQDDIVLYASNASFYLQTSVHEGMGMSVVESMQLGLVPIVTHVGEISSYCIHGVNAVIVDSDDEAVKNILHLLIANDRYLEIRSNAVATWQNHMLYRDSVLEACNELIQKGHEQH